ncbi:histidinol-phosphate transaminase [Verrucomicrobiota bacterium]
MTERVRKSVQSLSGYAPGEQPLGGGVVKLNTNENPYPPSPRVAAALAELDAQRLRLYPDPVCAALRDEIARIHRCGPDRVFVGNGSDEVLALCTRAFVENEGSIGYFDPSYSLYPVLADIRGVRKCAVSLDENFGLPAEETVPEEAVGCSLFFLANPNAPTGVLYPKEDVRRFCARGKGVVVIDEAYVDFASGDCADLALSMPNVLIARTLSKSYSLAGLRVGYAVGALELVEALTKIKDSYNLDMVSQVLALAALSDGAYMLENVERIRRTRRRLTAALSEMRYTVWPSETNFLWVRPAGVRAADLFRRLRERKILVRYFPGLRTGDFVRVTVGTDDEVDALLDALGSLG